MANLPEVAQWGAEEDGIYQFELVDFITGGAGGNDNEPHRLLANRTRYLKEQKADKNGNASNKFAVANGSASTEAVNRGQLDSVANTKANTSHTHPYLPLTGTAVDSNKLGGELPSRYIPQLLYKIQNPSINLTTVPVNYMNTWFMAKGEVCLLQNICSVYSDTTTLMDIVLTTKLYNYTKGVYEGIPQETRMSIRNTYSSAVLVNVVGHSFMTRGDIYILQIYVSRTSTSGLVKLQRIQSSGIVQ